MAAVACSNLKTNIMEHVHDAHKPANRSAAGSVQQAMASGTTLVQRMENNTGLPDNLKAGIESLSGYSMDDVKVHYNSAQPAQLQALAYAQGTDIHVAPGQERHLPHEAWHVVQQKQGRVKPTMQLKGKVNVNDDAGLEKEADTMGKKSSAHTSGHLTDNSPLQQKSLGTSPVQRLTGYEVETNIPVFSKYNEAESGLTELGKNGFTENIGWFLTGGLKYGYNYGEDPEGRYSISADHNELMNIHRKLIDKLIVLGLLKEDFQHRSLANIEYITPPRPEVAPGSVSEHEKDITAVKKHLDLTLGAASSKKVAEVPVPGKDILTGFPFSALLAWVEANGIQKTVIASELLALNAAINNSVYIQETSGVLPEDIPAVYDSASDSILHTDSPTHLSRLMADVMVKSKIIGNAAFVADPMPEAFVTHKKAIVGYMTLLASYLLGNTVSFLKTFSQAKSTSKNLVPFMSKTLLSDTLSALPLAVRPSGLETDPWLSFATNLNLEANKFPIQYWAENFQMDIDDTMDKGAVFPEGNAEALKKLIAGEKVTGVATGNLLGLDNPHAEVETATGQKAIPLEDRYFGKKQNAPLTSENMEKALGDRFKFAVSLSLSHIPEVDNKRKNAQDQIEGDIPAEHQEAELVKRIRSRIAAIRKLHTLLFAAGIIEEEIDPIITPWEEGITEALTKDSPAKEILLNAIDAEAYQGYTELQQSKSQTLNSSKDDDGEMTYETSVQRMFKDIDYELGKKFVDFKKKNLTPEKLKEQADKEEMTKQTAAIDRMWVLYSAVKKKLSEMNAETDVAERIKGMNQLGLILSNTGKKIKDAEEFHKSKPKAVLVAI